MKNIYGLALVVVFFSLLIAGCLGNSQQAAASPFQQASPTSVDPRELPLEESTKMMIEEMERTGGDPEVATAPIAQGQGFSGETERSGAFRKLGYTTDGRAGLEKMDGKHFVVLGDDFSTPNGPDLALYLTKNSNPTTREDFAQGVLLGELKSLKGKQVYEIPAGTKVDEYNSVSIHCRSFNVPWSYAPLG